MARTGHKAQLANRRPAPGVPVANVVPVVAAAAAPEPPRVTAAELKRSLDGLQAKYDELPVEGLEDPDELKQDCGQSELRWRKLKRAKYAYHMQVEELAFEVQELGAENAKLKLGPALIAAAEKRDEERRGTEDYLRYRLAQRIAKRMLGAERWAEFKEAWAAEWPVVQGSALPPEERVAGFRAELREEANLEEGGDRKRKRAAAAAAAAAPEEAAEAAEEMED